jgi:hypothetical protein
MDSGAAQAVLMYFVLPVYRSMRDQQVVRTPRLQGTTDFFGSFESAWM